jgi:hypothetical protein
VVSKESGDNSGETSKIQKMLRYTKGIAHIISKKIPLLFYGRGRSYKA